MRIYRESKGLTIPEFSEILTISSGSISDIENNNTKPSARPVAALIHNTDINIYWLFTGEGNPIRDSSDKKSSDFVDSDSFRIKALEKEVEILKEQMASLVNLQDEDKAREGHN